MVELQPSKLVVRVRSPSPAPQVRALQPGPPRDFTAVMPATCPSGHRTDWPSARNGSAPGERACSRQVSGRSRSATCNRLLKTILGTAVEDRLLRLNPCRIRGAATERSAERVPLTTEQVFILADAVPARFRVMVLLGTFCSLRFGEVGALTRADVDPVRGFIRVRHTLVEAGGPPTIGPPKSAAGRRLVAVPAALLPQLAQHLRSYVDAGPAAHVFVGAKGRPAGARELPSRLEAGVRVRRPARGPLP